MAISIIGEGLHLGLCIYVCVCVCIMFFFLLVVNSHDWWFGSVTDNNNNNDDDDVDERMRTKKRWKVNEWMNEWERSTDRRFFPTHTHILYPNKF